jgi:hypothetical protein
MLFTRTWLVFSVLVLFANVAYPFEARIEVSSENGINEIAVIIMDPTPPPPVWGDFIGYAVVRYKHSDCMEPVIISEVTEYTEPLSVTDDSPPSDSSYTYIVSLIKTDGTPGYSAGWLSIETLGGLEHPLFRADLRSGGVFGGGLFHLCPDLCWGHPYLGTLVGLSGSAPAELIEARDTGQVFDIYGTIEYFFEGPYLTWVSEAIEATCDGSVATESMDWDTLKALYR